MKRTQENLRLVAKIEAGISDPITSGISLDTLVHRCPYTYAEITYWTLGGEEWVVGHGFSKVCYPDVFNPDCGARLAIRRAAQHIVEQLNGRDAEDESWTGPPMEPSDEELIARVPLM